MPVAAIFSPPVEDFSDSLLTDDASERDALDPDNFDGTREGDEPEAGSDDDENAEDLSDVHTQLAKRQRAELLRLPPDWDVSNIFRGAAAFMVFRLVPGQPRAYSLEELSLAILRHRPLVRGIDWAFDTEDEEHSAPPSELELFLYQTLLMRSAVPTGLDWFNWPAYMLDIRAPYVFGARRLAMSGDLR